MIILLNGPLGVGKSTLSEALYEAIDGCVMLDGDQLVAANPPHVDAREHLHATIALLVAHHRSFGYRHFVINHLWTAADELEALRRRLLAGAPGEAIRCFRLTLPHEDNLRRIHARSESRALDELAFELRAVEEERVALARARGAELGEPFDVSARPAALVTELLRRIALGGRGLKSR